MFGGAHGPDLIGEMEWSDAGAEPVLVGDLNFGCSVAQEELRPAGEINVSGDVLLSGVGEGVLCVTMVPVAAKGAVCAMGLIPFGFEQAVIEGEDVTA